MERGISTERRYPFRYGADDAIGAVQEITPAKVLTATGLVTQGRCYSLAQILDTRSPAQMWRNWNQFLIADRTIEERAIGANQLSFAEDVVAGALHSGTHLDGLGHIGIGSKTYNGRAYHQILGPNGLSELGMETVPPIITRGVLLDVAAALGVESLGRSEEITAEHLKAAAARQDLRIDSGDVVLVHTGWGELWDCDVERYSATEPGLTLDAAKWCTEAHVAVIGADNWAVEVVPAEDSTSAFPVHQHCIAHYGVHLLENVRTAELARDGVHEFLCAVLPARLRGATASIVNPVAVV